MAINYSLIRLIPADETHREFSYQVKKAAEGDYIIQIWGWDEKVQRDFHTSDWETKRPQIILYDNEPIGTIFILENDGDIQIGQFFILPEYQDKSIGTYILKDILDKADASGGDTRLACLENNPVSSLYIRHGFEIVRKKEKFIFMERKPGG